MQPTMTVSVNEEGHAVVTHAVPLIDYCVQRAQMLRAMVQVVSMANGAGDGACLTSISSSKLGKPLMELIRTHIDELEPLFKALDQRAYEKGFEDGKDVGYPKRNQLALAKEIPPSA